MLVLLKFIFIFSVFFLYLSLFKKKSYRQRTKYYWKRLRCLYKFIELQTKKKSNSMLLRNKFRKK